MLENYEFMTYSGNKRVLPEQLNYILNRLTNTYHLEHISDIFQDESNTISFKYRLPMHNAIKVPTHYIAPLFYSFLNNGLCKEIITKEKNIYMIGYILEGEGILKYEDNIYNIDENEGFIIPYRNTFHFTPSNGKIKFFNFHFAGSSMDYIYKEFLEDDLIVFRNIDPSKFNILMSAIIAADTSTSSHKEFHCNIAIERLLEAILYKETQNTGGNKPLFVLKAQKFINKNFREKITLEDIAAHCGISKYHLSREFKTYIGLSPSEYLINVRLYNAQFLLLTTDLPISEIAVQVGFQNESNFRRQFQKKYEKNASEFRKQKNFSQQDIIFEGDSI